MDEEERDRGNPVDALVGRTLEAMTLGVGAA
jgi:hypothetical protein